MQLDLASAQMDGDFPQVAFERDSGIEPHTPGGPCQEKALPVGVGGKLAQTGGLLREAFGRRLAAQSAVGAAMIFALQPFARSGCLSNRDHGLDRVAAALQSPSARFEKSVRSSPCSKQHKAGHGGGGCSKWRRPPAGGEQVKILP